MGSDRIGRPLWVDLTVMLMVGIWLAYLARDEIRVWLGIG